MLHMDLVSHIDISRLGVYGYVLPVRCLIHFSQFSFYRLLYEIYSYCTVYCVRFVFLIWGMGIGELGHTL